VTHGHTYYAEAFLNVLGVPERYQLGYKRYTLCLIWSVVITGSIFVSDTENTWYKDEETGDVTHYCVGHTDKEKMNKPSATATDETYWFNPATLVEESENTFECKACGARVVPLGDNFTLIGE
jgi:hypothetical protein